MLQMRQLIVLGLLIVFGVSKGASQTQYRVLPKDFNADKTQQMMRSYLRWHVHESLDRRLEELGEALESQEGIAAYQKKRREFLPWTFGEMPKRSPRVHRLEAGLAD